MDELNEQHIAGFLGGMIFQYIGDSLRKKTVLRPVQNYLKWMTYLVYQFFKAEELVSNTCTAALAAAKVCLELPEHRRVVCCEQDSPNFEYALPTLVYISQSTFGCTVVCSSDRKKRMKQASSLQRYF